MHIEAVRLLTRLYPEPELVMGWGLERPERILRSPQGLGRPSLIPGADRPRGWRNSRRPL